MSPSSGHRDTGPPTAWHHPRAAVGPGQHNAGYREENPSQGAQGRGNTAALDPRLPSLLVREQATPAREADEEAVSLPLELTLLLSASQASVLKHQAGRVAYTRRVISASSGGRTSEMKVSGGWFLLASLWPQRCPLHPAPFRRVRPCPMPSSSSSSSSRGIDFITRCSSKGNETGWTYGSWLLAVTQHPSPRLVISFLKHERSRSILSAAFTYTIWY